MIPVILLLIQLNALDLQSSDCSRFKTGNFYTETPKLGKTFIYRTDSIHIEKNDSVGYHYVLKVNWVSDCMYELSLLENKSSNKKFDPPSQEFKMSVIITEVQNDSYKISASFNGGPYKYAGIIHKIETED
jgi:hypothetical protein